MPPFSYAKLTVYTYQTFDHKSVQFTNIPLWAPSAPPPAEEVVAPEPIPPLPPGEPADQENLGEESADEHGDVPLELEPDQGTTEGSGSVEVEAAIEAAPPSEVVETAAAEPEPADAVNPPEEPPVEPVPCEEPADASVENISAEVSKDESSIDVAPPVDPPCVDAEEALVLALEETPEVVLEEPPPTEVILTKSVTFAEPEFTPPGAVPEPDTEAETPPVESNSPAGSDPPAAASKVPSAEKPKANKSRKLAKPSKKSFSRDRLEKPSPKEKSEPPPAKIRTVKSSSKKKQEKTKIGKNSVPPPAPEAPKDSGQTSPPEAITAVVAQESVREPLGAATNTAAESEAAPSIIEAEMEQPPQDTAASETTPPDVVEPPALEVPAEASPVQDSATVEVPEGADDVKQTEKPVPIEPLAPSTQEIANEETPETNAVAEIPAAIDETVEAAPIEVAPIEVATEPVPETAEEAPSSEIATVSETAVGGEAEQAEKTPISEQSDTLISTDSQPDKNPQDETSVVTDQTVALEESAESEAEKAEEPAIAPTINTIAGEATEAGVAMEDVPAKVEASVPDNKAIVEGETPTLKDIEPNGDGAAEATVPGAFPADLPAMVETAATGSQPPAEESPTGEECAPPSDDTSPIILAAVEGALKERSEYPAESDPNQSSLTEEAPKPEDTVPAATETTLSEAVHAKEAAPIAADTAVLTEASEMTTETAVEPPASEPAPEPEPETEPVLPEPEASEPTIEVVPEPDVDTAHEPAAETASEAIVEETPQPTIEAIPESIVEATPEPVIIAALETARETTIEPPVEAAPEVVVEATLESAIELAPEPIAEPTVSDSGPSHQESAIVDEPANDDVSPLIPPPSPSSEKRRRHRPGWERERRYSKGSSTKSGDSPLLDRSERPERPERKRRESDVRSKRSSTMRSIDSEALERPKSGHRRSISYKDNAPSGELKLVRPKLATKAETETRLPFWATVSKGLGISTRPALDTQKVPNAGRRNSSRKSTEKAKLLPEEEEERRIRKEERRKEREKEKEAEAAAEAEKERVRAEQEAASRLKREEREEVEREAARIRRKERKKEKEEEKVEDRERSEARRVRRDRRAAGERRIPREERGTEKEEQRLERSETTRRESDIDRENEKTQRSKRSRRDSNIEKEKGKERLERPERRRRDSNTGKEKKSRNRERSPVPAVKIKNAAVEGLKRIFAS